MVSSDHDNDIMNHSQLKTKKENFRINEKWRMNKNVEWYKIIYTIKRS